MELLGEQKTMVTFFEGCEELRSNIEAHKQLLVELCSEQEAPTTGGKFLVLGRPPISSNHIKQELNFWKKGTLDFSIVDMSEC